MNGINPQDPIVKRIHMAMGVVAILVLVVWKVGLLGAN